MKLPITMPFPSSSNNNINSLLISSRYEYDDADQMQDIITHELSSDSFNVYFPSNSDNFNIQSTNDSNYLWNQSRLEDIVTDFEPSDTRLDMLSDDISIRPLPFLEENFIDAPFSNLQQNFNSSSNSNKNKLHESFQSSSHIFDKNNQLLYEQLDNKESQYSPHLNQTLSDYKDYQLKNEYYCNLPSTSTLETNSLQQNENYCDKVVYQESIYDNKYNDSSNYSVENENFNNVEPYCTQNSLEVQNHSTNFEQNYKIETDNDDKDQLEKENLEKDSLKENYSKEDCMEEDFDDDKENLFAKKRRGLNESKEAFIERILKDLPSSNGYYRPPMSYSCLITLALKNSETGELTVSEIYAFLCEHFPFFKTAAPGWKNSVRHNLSLNKSFEKIDVETPGFRGRKSCLWGIHPSKKYKMNRDLRRNRKAFEDVILVTMKNAKNFNAIQSGKMGMPATMRQRPITIPIKTTTSNALTTCPISVGKQNTTAAKSISQPKTTNLITESDTNSFSPFSPSSSNYNTSHLSVQSSSNFVKYGESMRQVAIRKLDYLLQKKSATILNPNKELFLVSMQNQNNYEEPSPKRLILSSNNNTSFTQIVSTNNNSKFRSNNLQNLGNNQTPVSNTKLKLLTPSDAIFVNSKRHSDSNFSNNYDENVPPNYNKSTNSFQEQIVGHLQLSSASSNFRITERQPLQSKFLPNMIPINGHKSHYKIINTKNVVKDVTNTLGHQENNNITVVTKESKDLKRIQPSKNNEKLNKTNSYDDYSTYLTSFSSAYNTINDAISNHTFENLNSQNS